MRSRSRLRCEWLMVGILAAVGGCSSGVQFRIKTSQPWPDEWVSGARVPYERTVQLTPKTVAWHRKADGSAIEAEITRELTGRPGLYGFVRRGIAQPLGAMDLSKGLPYVEVKIAPCFFDFGKPPPKVTLHYERKTFSEAIADLMKRAGRSYLISPALADTPPITAHLTQLDWREAAVRIMLEVNVFIEPVWYNPISLRSYEYESQAEFQSAVRRAMDAMKNPTPGAALTVVPWDQWVAHNRAYQLRYVGTLRNRATSQRFGPPPGTAVLNSDLAIAKKQILYALPHQLKRPKRSRPAEER